MCSKDEYYNDTIQCNKCGGNMYRHYLQNTDNSSTTVTEYKLVYKCRICNNMVQKMHSQFYQGRFTKQSKEDWKYCPHCGKEL